MAVTYVNDGGSVTANAASITQSDGFLTTLYKDIGFIGAFVATLAVLQMTVGEEPVKWLLYLIIFSMIMINSDKFINFMQEVTTYGK